MKYVYILPYFVSSINFFFIFASFLLEFVFFFLLFQLYLAHDQNARVKVSAINTITKCLALVKRVPRSDANIFPEYILPGLAPLATDPNTCVRAAYAQNIATLAEISVRLVFSKFI